MDDIPIVIGKDVSYNNIQQVKTHGNVILTSLYQREYFTMNIFGRLSGGTAIDGSYEWRKLLITIVPSGTAAFWWDTPPDPNNNIGGCVRATNNFTFSPTLGNIQGLNINKNYLVNLNLNFNTLNIDRTTTFEICFVNTDTNYNTNLNDSFGTNFTPRCSALATENIDYNGLSMNMSYVIAGCKSFTMLYRQQNAGNIETNQYKYDTNITMSILEL